MTGDPAMAVSWLRRLAREPDRRDDGRLLDAFLNARDESAFVELLRRHGPLVLGVCRRLLRDPHDVEDAFQATFLVLIRKARSIGRRERLAGWLYGVAFRTAQKARFRRSRRAAVERQGEMLLEPSREAATPPDAAERLDRELLALPEKYRLPLVLCELQGLSRRDAARHLKLAEGTLSSRLARGRVLLRKRLERAGVTMSATGLLATLSTETRAELSETLLQAALRSAAATLAGAPMKSAANSLAEGVLKTMLFEQIRKVSGVVLLLMTVTGLGVLAGAPTPAAPPAPAQAADKLDRDRLQGDWELVDVDGRAASESERAAWYGRLKIEGERVTERHETAGLTMSFHLNDQVAPKRIDWSVPRQDSFPGLQRQWIYKFDGTQLVLCGQISGAHDDFPAEFAPGVRQRELHFHVLTYRHAPAQSPAKPAEPVQFKILLGKNFETPSDSATVLLGGLKKQPYLIAPPDVLRLEVDNGASGTQQMDLLVRPDGTIALGTYGTVEVEGLTDEQAAKAVARLIFKKTQKDGNVRLSVLSPNSRFYYLLVEGAAVDVQVHRFPFTGAETVLDAMSQIRDQFRETPPASVSIERGKETLLVDWPAIVLDSKSSTNRPLQAGDRLHVRLLQTRNGAWPAEPEPHYVNRRQFKIPFQISQRGPTPPGTLTLRVSRELRKGWQSVQTVNSAETDHFRYTADEDGEYWFAVTQDRAPESGAAVLHVLVDTQCPVIKLFRAGSKEEPAIQWQIQDANPDVPSLRISYRPNREAAWQLLPVTPALTGLLRIDQTPSAEVRFECRDKAGNYADLISHCDALPAPRAGSPVQLSPPMPLGPGQEK